MADLPELSRIAQVPVREVWAHEAHQFTQWLRVNADVLSEILGMNLDLTGAEHRVGGFALDLIGKDLQTGETVIIENQLEATDHGHLGQLLTYAGGTDPATVVWCAPVFRDEHRAALDWLNDHTDEGIRFFGVEISAVRIDGSVPAPLFRLVAQPNDWSKRLHAETAAATSLSTPRSDAYEALWRLVLDRIRAEHPTWTNARAGSRDSWITLPFGTSSAWYALVCAGSAARVELYFGSSNPEVNEREFQKYSNHRAELESRFGGALDFQPLPGRKACRIAAHAPRDFDVLNHTEHPELVEWFIDAMSRFREATQAVRGAMPSDNVDGSDVQLPAVSPAASARESSQ